MADVSHGRYVGPKDEWRGWVTGLVRPHPTDPGQVQVQTDGRYITRNGVVDLSKKDWEATSLGYGWHDFPRDHWADVARSARRHA